MFSTKKNKIKEELKLRLKDNRGFSFFDKPKELSKEEIKNKDKRENLIVSQITTVNPLINRLDKIKTYGVSDVLLKENYNIKREFNPNGDGALKDIIWNAQSAQEFKDHLAERVSMFEDKKLNSQKIYDSLKTPPISKVEIDYLNEDRVLKKVNIQQLIKKSTKKYKKQNSLTIWKLDFKKWYANFMINLKYRLFNWFKVNSLFVGKKLLLLNFSKPQRDILNKLDFNPYDFTSNSNIVKLILKNKLNFKKIQKANSKINKDLLFE